MILIVLVVEWEIAVSIHELSHALLAKLFSIDIERICLGTELFCVQLGKLRISPIIPFGFVEISFSLPLEENKSKYVMFYLSGIVGNAFLMICAIMLLSDFAQKAFLIINIMMIVSAVLPLRTDNDLVMAYRILSDTLDVR